MSTSSTVCPPCHCCCDHLELLWCESCCSDETKPAAKAIDLCNNPLNKKPKVSMAKRIISRELFEESGVELDGEVQKYEDEYRAFLF